MNRHITGYKDSYIRNMFDKTLVSNPLRQVVTFIFNRNIRDQYGDSTSVEERRVVKFGLVKKDVQSFVQFDEATLLEDPDNIPWVVTVSVTDFIPDNQAPDLICTNKYQGFKRVITGPGEHDYKDEFFALRIPRMDDHILIENTLFTISQVKPINRESPSILCCLIYPERNLPFDKVFDGCCRYTLLNSDYSRLNPVLAPTHNGATFMGFEWIMDGSEVEAPANGYLKLTSLHGCPRTISIDGVEHEWMNRFIWNFPFTSFSITVVPTQIGDEYIETLPADHEYYQDPMKEFVHKVDDDDTYPLRDPIYSYTQNASSNAPVYLNGEHGFEQDISTETGQITLTANFK